MFGQDEKEKEKKSQMIQALVRDGWWKIKETLQPTKCYKEMLQEYHIFPFTGQCFWHIGRREYPFSLLSPWVDYLPWEQLHWVVALFSEKAEFPFLFDEDDDDDDRPQYIFSLHKSFDGRWSFSEWSAIWVIQDVWLHVFLWDISLDFFLSPCTFCSDKESDFCFSPFIILFFLSFSSSYIIFSHVSWDDVRQRKREGERKTAEKLDGKKGFSCCSSCFFSCFFCRLEIFLLSFCFLLIIHHHTLFSVLFMLSQFSYASCLRVPLRFRTLDMSFFFLTSLLLYKKLDQLLWICRDFTLRFYT